MGMKLGAKMCIYVNILMLDSSELQVVYDIVLCMMSYFEYAFTYITYKFGNDPLKV